MRETISPSTVITVTPRHSASKPSCEVPCPAQVKTAPRSLNRCADLDVDVEVLVELPSGTDVFETFAGRKRCHAAVVDTHHIRCRRCDFTPIVRSENSPRSPTMCRAWAAASPARYRASSSAMAASKSSRSNTTTPAIRSSASTSDDLEGIVLNRLGIRARHANSCEGEALAAGCQDARHRHREADINGCLSIFDVGISTMQDPGVHYPPAIVDRDVLGRYLSHGVPLAGSNVRVKALEYTRCGVFQPRRRSAELVEPRDRGVEVSLVEYLAAADHVTFDRQQDDLPPLGVEAFSRGPCAGVTYDCAEIIQPMHSLDIDIDVWREVPLRPGYTRHVAGRERDPPSVVDCRPSPPLLREARVG